ncbi:MipA/OmpV family protein [Endozoicomonas sp.]|uniref:MipA/OmpV family protein n=1 Tax=Endozoicomonas sp. TaxID=1892382 RepID=UPI00383A7085
MKLRSSVVATCLLGACSFTSAVWAQENENPVVVGLGVQYESSIYQDMDAEINPAVIVSFDYGDFWVRHESVGYTLFSGDNWSLSPVLTMDMGEGFEVADADDNSRLYDGLEDRDSGFGYGITLAYDMQWAELSTSLLQDTESSYSVEMELAKAYQITDKLSLEPAISLAYRSASYNDYYFGIDEDEASKNSLLTAYDADSGVDMGLAMTASYELSPQWIVMGQASYTRFSSAAKDSVLVDSNNQASVAMGIAYIF